MEKTWEKTPSRFRHLCVTSVTRGRREGEGDACAQSAEVLGGLGQAAAWPLFHSR